jgi:transposase
VDLLPDRKAASVKAWLKEHPGVAIISRDRAKAYIKGATEGASEALQVADRFHLVKNLRENLERWLETKPVCLKAAADSPTPDSSEQEKPPSKPQEKLSSTDVERSEKKQPPRATEQPPETSVKLTRAEEGKLARRKKRQDCYEAVKKLHEQGLSKSEISRHLHIDRKTVCKYIQAESCPMYPEGRMRASKLDPYKEYITNRFNEGCTNATKILDEIHQLGYSGCRTVMMDWVKKALRPLHPKPTNSSQKKVVQKVIAPWTARRASWLLMKDYEELSEEDQQALERMKQSDEKVDHVYTLSQRFVVMIKERKESSLLPWLEEAKKSGIDTLKQFAKGIKQDINAVTNALSLPWSQGQVEGQVNRLKLIKRQMYGRANFDLLRKRVLFNPI